jgi:predicted AlkP superfamily pyrophosphatase or phosphodiesterase
VRSSVPVALLVAAAVCVASACGRSHPSGPSPAGSPTATPSAPQTTPPGRVTIISIDGLRPDAILSTGAPNILALAGRGAYTWRARTVMPSTTLPSHVSMLSGVEPAVHGIVWDEYEPARGRLSVPTIFSVARDRGKRTAVVTGKSKFAYFCDSGACDSWTIADRSDDDVVGRVSGGPDLLFVHLPDVDRTGHALQWMSDAYLTAVRRADDVVGRIVAALPPDTTVILTADHGGHVDGHGTSEPVDVTIPWVIAGPHTAKGKALSATIRTVDTAATAAYVLGVPLPGAISGRAILEAFE